VALYIGFASEFPLIRARNPNLNFNVVMVPQIQDTARAVTYARMYAFAVPNGSRNPAGARTVALVLAEAKPSALMAQARGTPSPRRDILAQQKDGVEAVFRNSAIVGRGWLDPDPEATAAIFRTMISGAISGASRLSEAAQQADRAMNNLLGF
jgi:ABC-type glycerol-3-phosphate transport system substrate-binding protein